MTPPAQVYQYDLKDSISKRRLTGFWKMTVGFRWLYIGAVMTLGIGSILQTLSFLLIRSLVDDALLQPNMLDLLPPIALGFIALAFGQGVFTFLSGRMAAKTSEGIALRLRDYMFDHIQYLSFTYHDNMKTGELIQRATSDVDAVRRFFSEQAIGIGRIVLLFGVNWIMLLALNWQLGLASVVVIPFIVVVSLWFFKRVSDAYEKMQDQEAKVSTALQENLSGVRVVKAFARQGYERDKFEGENIKRFRLGRRFLLMHSAFWPVTDIVCTLQVLAGFIIAANMVLNSEITLGTYLTYVMLIGWLINPIRNLGRLIVQMSAGLVSYDRVMEVIREDREPVLDGAHQPDDNLKGHVVFDHVGFAYHKDEPVLHDISFEARPGQVVALLGSTGSGKTTLISLLPRFYEYTSGKITLDGVDLKDYPRHFLRRQIGVVMQEPFLFSRTIRENITYGIGRAVSDAEVEAAARAAAVHDVIMTFPEGYNTLVGERGVTLSGGQKQRVTVARTLLKDPRILILDDATSSVDTETEETIREALKTLMKGRTTFVIAHRIQSVMYADLILVMDKGRIVQRGTHAELLQQEGIYRQVYDLQSRIEDEIEKEMADVRLAV